jgi:hypothetical protein
MFPVLRAGISYKAARNIQNITRRFIKSGKAESGITVQSNIDLH